jgi:hypothetical protein
MQRGGGKPVLGDSRQGGQEAGTKNEKLFHGTNIFNIKILMGCGLRISLSLIGKDNSIETTFSINIFFP